jgi:4-hydroxybenzoate polyprenyltransferase
VNYLNTISDYQNPLFYRERTSLVALYHSLHTVISLLTVTSAFTAFVGALILYISFSLYGVGFDVSLFLAGFLLIFAVYNINKLTDLNEDAINLPERARFIEKYKHHMIFLIVLASLGALSLSLLRTPYAMGIALVPFCIGLMYSVTIANFRLKDVIGLKNAAIAVSFAVCAAFFPLAIHSCDSVLVVLIFCFVFLKIFINTIVLDVRDIEGDSKNGVHTIPVRIGAERTRVMLLLLNVTLIVWLAFCCFHGLFCRYLPVLGLSIGYGCCYTLHFCREGNPVRKSIEFLVDGEWLLIACAASLAAALPCHLLNLF